MSGNPPHLFVGKKKPESTPYEWLKHVETMGDGGCINMFFENQG
jgi:hypothetical protein